MPITQNERHMQVIKEVRKSGKGNIITKTMFEIADSFLEKNQEDRTDYAEKYKKLLERAEDSKVQESIKESVTSDGNEDKQALIKALKAFRLEKSRQEQVKAYFIFNDTQMEDLIKKNSQNKEELCQVSSFGKVKAEKYGDAILEVLRREGK